MVGIPNRSRKKLTDGMAIELPRQQSGIFRHQITPFEAIGGRTSSKIVSLLLLMLSLSAPAFAQDAGQAQAGQGGGDKPIHDILGMDIEQLSKVDVRVPSMDMPVTSVKKEASTVGRSAAAVFVITNEMIRRSGVTSIPEALRMAPGIEVAQVNSNTWAISCRGFCYVYANMLLVLIDGRAVYNPDMSGVYWNVQDVLLEDVERIEVIRGPGGTLWGANAVNGVISIITKRANDTQGVYAQAGGGTHEKDFEAFRYGGQIGEDLHYRVYGKHFERGANVDLLPEYDDAWRQGRFGFRADWEPDRDKTNTFTVQGDHYVGNTDNVAAPMTTGFVGPENLTGENLLMRWRHVYDEDSEWTLQAYYDNYTRINSWQSEIDKTFDVDFQYRFLLADRHTITCGGGFRSVDSYLAGGDQFGNWFPTPYLTTNYTNEFIQDEIALVEDRLTFTLGCKLEQNPYTGLEYQPTARLLLTPDRRHSAWCAVSRAVRTPSRFERQATETLGPIVFDPLTYYRLFGNSGLVSEEVLAYEAGYREQATEQFSWDVALFYNTYNRLVTISPQWPPVSEPLPEPSHDILQLLLDNSGSGDTYGVELAGDYAIRKWWRLHAQYTYLNISMQTAGTDPPNQVYLRSSWDIRENMDFDLTCRYVDRLSAIEVPSYISMDLRLAYRPRKHLELAVVGQNLLQEYHQEYDTFPQGPVTYVPRGVYGTLEWRR